MGEAWRVGRTGGNGAIADRAGGLGGEGDVMGPAPSTRAALDRFDDADVNARRDTMDVAAVTFPLEILETRSGYVRVKDAAGADMWLRSSQLRIRRDAPTTVCVASNRPQYQASTPGIARNCP
ncbi:hypothetical protein [Pigmentiphaga litoralis]|uniref:hypothetical protein n=1 Tax=Pigmentiphaga litoralis TaxID=516702 RepID=UPI003B434AE4